MNYLAYPILNKILCSLVTFVAAITDTKTGKIFNWLTLPAIVIGWGLCFYFQSWSGLGYSVLASLFGIALYLPLALLGAYGMGDVKLMGAVGAFCGSAFTFSVFLYASALGIIHAIIISIMNYGTETFMRLFTSIRSGNFKYNSIQKENSNPANQNKIKFHLGIDIFLATLIACYHSFVW